MRLTRLRASLREVLDLLAAEGIHPVVLKGFARAGDFVPDPGARMPYDLDLYCPEEASAAQSILLGAGFAGLAGSEGSALHLSPLVRKTDWKWRGDFFDLEIPAAVEIHFRLWDGTTEGFAAPGLDGVWKRRRHDATAGMYILNRADDLVYRSLHALRHLLRGSVRMAHFYEIAWFLDRSSADHSFWSEWEPAHAARLRAIAGISFAIAARWFHCRMHGIAERQIGLIPEGALRWIEVHGAAPVESFFRPAKPELGLHLALLESKAAKLRILRRRLFPARLPERMWDDPGGYLRRIGKRAAFHARSLPATLSRMLIIRR